MRAIARKLHLLPGALFALWIAASFPGCATDTVHSRPGPASVADERTGSAAIAQSE